MANKKSDTMELDSILNEARTRKLGSSSGASAARNTAPRQSAPVRRPAQQRSLNDDFIITDDNGYAPRKQNTRPNPGYNKPAPKKKKKHTGLIVTLCVVFILLIAGVGGWILIKYNIFNLDSDKGPESTFADNVSVGGKSLKGLTMDEARALMKSVEDEMANGIRVEIKAGDKSFTYGKDDFHYTFDTEAVLSEAKAYSEEIGFKTEEKDYDITMKVDDSTCQAIITKISGDVKQEAKNARVTGFDTSADSMFTITGEQKGTSLDEQTSLDALKSFINSGKITGTVEATVKEVDPKYTKDFLNSNITKLSSFSTVSSNNWNGNENMRVSLAACDGSIIDPGTTWSFNDCTGNSNLESNGYKPAGVIVEGRSETGVGGGICQSSTTIYNACIRSGMDVEERECHYYKSVYVDAGLDATVDYGNIDLKMSNPFDYQLFMKCWMDGATLYCEIYGLENPEFDDIEITTSDINYTGNGFSVDTYRTFYKDGKEVRSEKVSKTSTYYTSAPSSGSSGSGSSGGDDDDSGSSGGGDSSSGDGGSSSGGDSGSGGGEGGDSGEGGGDSGEGGGDSGEGGGGEAPVEDGGGSGGEE